MFKVMKQSPSHGPFNGHWWTIDESSNKETAIALAALASKLTGCNTQVMTDDGVVIARFEAKS